MLFTCTARRVLTFLRLVSRLNTLGYRIGTRYLELLSWRTESLSKNPKREIRFLPAIMMIHTQLWRAIFGKPADAIERSVENSDECKCCQVVFLLFLSEYPFKFLQICLLIMIHLSLGSSRYPAT